MDFDKLSPELAEKVKACSSPQELIDLAKQEGYKLSEEELEGIAGGCCMKCNCVDVGCSVGSVPKSASVVDMKEMRPPLTLM